ncbi:hypothetical protein GFL54_32305 [Rhizobium laguerreae]|nr:hypothetical protein [Rhizobium laguerreae]NKM71409.1 hypothetical protein [Rhizobium laguerreae]NKM88828.1 hypothetical protein [Rhizobium laguerreae]
MRTPVKTGKGTCLARGEWGTERSRHIPFAPFTGRRCRQADEGRATETTVALTAERRNLRRSP